MAQKKVKVVEKQCLVLTSFSRVSKSGTYQIIVRTPSFAVQSITAALEFRYRFTNDVPSCTITCTLYNDVRSRCAWDKAKTRWWLSGWSDWWTEQAALCAARWRLKVTIDLFHRRKHKTDRNTAEKIFSSYCNTANSNLLRGEVIVSTKPRLKRVYDFLGLVYCLIKLRAS